MRKNYARRAAEICGIRTLPRLNILIILTLLPLYVNILRQIRLLLRDYLVKSWYVQNLGESHKRR